MLDVGSQVYDVWQDDYGVNFCGTRHRETGHEHGIVRSCKYGDAIVEASYKHGVRHGFCRAVWPDEVAIQIFKNDYEVAYFKFGRRFKETIRFGEQIKLLEGLSPADFIVPVADPDPKFEASTADTLEFDLESQS